MLFNLLDVCAWILFTVSASCFLLLFTCCNKKKAPPKRGAALPRPPSNNRTNMILVTSGEEPPPPSKKKPSTKEAQQKLVKSPTLKSQTLKSSTMKLSQKNLPSEMKSKQSKKAGPDSASEPKCLPLGHTKKKAVSKPEPVKSTPAVVVASSEAYLGPTPQGIEVPLTIEQDDDESAAKKDEEEEEESNNHSHIATMDQGQQTMISGEHIEVMQKVIRSQADEAAKKHTKSTFQQTSTKVRSTVHGHHRRRHSRESQRIEIFKMADKGQQTSARTEPKKLESKKLEPKKLESKKLETKKSERKKSPPRPSTAAKKKAEASRVESRRGSPPKGIESMHISPPLEGVAESKWIAPAKTTEQEAVTVPSHGNVEQSSNKKSAKEESKSSEEESSEESEEEEDQEQSRRRPSGKERRGKR